MGMTSIDGFESIFCRPRVEITRKSLSEKTTANVWNKVKGAVASAFRVPAPVAALA